MALFAALAADSEDASPGGPLRTNRIAPLPPPPPDPGSNTKKYQRQPHPHLAIDNNNSRKWIGQSAETKESRCKAKETRIISCCSCGISPADPAEHHDYRSAQLTSSERDGYIIDSTIITALFKLQVADCADDEIQFRRSQCHLLG